MLNRIDHLVLAAPTLKMGMEYIADLSGLSATMGGKHPQFGTLNALLKIGKDKYLEILAPDPDNPKTNRLWMGLSWIEEPAITRIALKSKDMEEEAKLLNQYSVLHGLVQAGKRRKPNGDLLEWQLSLPIADPMISDIPFLIDWGNSAHPSETLSDDCQVNDITLFTPNTTSITKLYDQLGIEAKVQEAKEIKISLTLETPKGLLTLE